MGKIDTYIVTCRIRCARGRIKPFTIKGIIFYDKESKLKFTRANVEAQARLMVLDSMRDILSEYSLCISDFILKIELQGIESFFRAPLGIKI